ncbi:MAG: hypothetical protein ACOX7F_05285 [Eubacteriales bacterium]
MKKFAITSIIAVAVAFTCLLGLVGCQEKNTDDTDDAAANEVIATEIDNGDISNHTGLRVSQTLNEGNGKYVNLYVENNGTNSVVATINGQSEKTFQAGEKGSISLEVEQDHSGSDKEYQFKVVPGTNGGTIDIHYEIVQDSDYST